MIVTLALVSVIQMVYAFPYLLVWFALHHRRFTMLPEHQPLLQGAMHFHVQQTESLRGLGSQASTPSLSVTLVVAVKVQHRFLHLRHVCIQSIKSHRLIQLPTVCLDMSLLVPTTETSPEFVTADPWQHPSDLGLGFRVRVVAWPHQ